MTPTTVYFTRQPFKSKVKVENHTVLTVKDLCTRFFPLKLVEVKVQNVKVNDKGVFCADHIEEIADFGEIGEDTLRSWVGYCFHIANSLFPDRPTRKDDQYFVEHSVDPNSDPYLLLENALYNISIYLDPQYVVETLLEMLGEK